VSRKNVEIVREIHDAWARGDFALGSDRLAPEFEWHQFPQAVEPGTRRGAEVGESFRRVFEVYEDVRVDSSEFIEADDKVIVVGRVFATARGSGMPLDSPIAFVWTLRDGKLVRNELFTDRQEALEAAEVRE
jgi:ketosteroid isomerase-like protein